jgi:hypothetical protein
MPLELAWRWSSKKWVFDRDLWWEQIPQLSESVEQEVWFVAQVASLPLEVTFATSSKEVQLILIRAKRTLMRVMRGELSTAILIGVLLVHLLAHRFGGLKSGLTDGPGCKAQHPWSLRHALHGTVVPLTEPDEHSGQWQRCDLEQPFQQATDIASATRSLYGDG